MHLIALRLLPLLVLCAAPSVAAQAARDPAAHRVGFVQSGGARLHYLEWPGRGPTVVLLPGYSLTAHVFDDIGARLSEDYRVVALTPRGFGESDAPDSSAYTVATLVSDVAALLDTLGIGRAVLVGHSLSGTVAAQFALRFPERVMRLILLDSYPYFVEEGGDSVDALNPVPMPAFEGDTTYDAVGRYLAKYRFVPWQAALDADLRAKPIGPEAVRRRALNEGYIADQWRAPPGLGNLTVSAAQVCAIPTVSSEYPWLEQSSSEYHTARAYVMQALRPLSRRLCHRFARTVPGGTVVELTGSHYLFFSRPDATVAALRRLIR